MAYQMTCSSDNRWWHDLTDSEGRCITGVGATAKQAIEDAEKDLAAREEYISKTDIEKLQLAVDNGIDGSTHERELLKIVMKQILRLSHESS